MDDVYSQHVFLHSIYPFFLSICLRIIHYVEDQLYPKTNEKCLPKLRGELKIPIKDYLLQYTMQSHSFLYKNLGNVTSLIGGFNNYELPCSAYLPPPLWHHALLSYPWKPRNEVHEMTSHFRSRMGIDCSNPTRCLHSSFTCWHSKHLAMYSATSLFMPS